MTLDDEDIELIARRVAQLIDSSHPRALPQYVDAADLAQMLGIDRDWIYAHARELGAIRLGGPNGRLRFDVRQVSEALADARPAKQPRRRASVRGRGSRAEQMQVIQYER